MLLKSCCSVFIINSYICKGRSQPSLYVIREKTIPIFFRTKIELPTLSILKCHRYLFRTVLHFSESKSRFSTIKNVTIDNYLSFSLLSGAGPGTSELIKASSNTFQQRDN